MSQKTPAWFEALKKTMPKKVKKSVKVVLVNQHCCLLHTERDAIDLRHR